MPESLADLTNEEREVEFGKYPRLSEFAWRLMTSAQEDLTMDLGRRLIDEVWRAERKGGPDGARDQGQAPT